MTQDTAQIAQAVDHMQRVTDDTAGRLERARDAGAALAAAVYAFAENVGMPQTAPLYKAYRTFMAMDSGNFGPLEPEA